MPYPYPILDRDLWPKRGAAPHVKNVVCNGRAQKKTLTKILAKFFVSRIAKMKSNGWQLNIHVSPLSDAYLGTGHLVRCAALTMMLSRLVG